MPQYLCSRNEKNKQPYIFLSSLPVGYDVVIPMSPVRTISDCFPIIKGAFRFETTGKMSQITIDGSYAWNFSDQPIRQHLRTDFDQFLIELENREARSDALALIRESIAQYMPLTFEEMLYYRYGFDSTQGYIDLQPGMRLRVDYEVNQFVFPVSPENSEQQHFNGFVGGDVAHYHLCSDLENESGPQISFDPFLRLMMQSRIVDANVGGAGGVIDLQNSPRPHYRVCYPSNFVSSDSHGYVGTAKNVTLIGADTLAHLEAATTAYLDTGNCDDHPVVRIFFRGRAIVIPEISIFVQGKPTYVSIGTTIRQILERYLYSPMITSQVLNAFQNRRCLNVHKGPFPNYIPVIYTYEQYWNGLDVLDQPVVKADACAFPSPNV